MDRLSERTVSDNVSTSKSRAVQLASYAIACVSLVPATTVLVSEHVLPASLPLALLELAAIAAGAASRAQHSVAAASITQRLRRRRRCHRRSASVAISIYRIALLGRARWGYCRAGRVERLSAWWGAWGGVIAVCNLAEVTSDVDDGRGRFAR